ncbi:MAG: hypothetical protein JWQ09_2966 [Segetibacter sp.]|nr:hypothetical protein [Segetibacter sp.]
MDFIIKKESNKASLIKAAQKLMEDGRCHEWLRFLVDVHTAAIHSALENTVGSIDKNTLQSIAFKVNDLSHFFSQLINIEKNESDN